MRKKNKKIENEFIYKDIEEKIKTIIDMMSAVVILEDFINNLKRSN